jgi:hypothetical protein
MTDEKKPFTVTDRRLFTPDGERRDAEEAEPREREARPARDTRAPAARSPLEGAGPAAPTVDFTSFLLGLGAQAGMLLGPEAQPADLAGARELIGILEMLRDKTEGRRSADEEEVLEGLLYELRMAYLHKTGGGGA